MGVDMRFFLGVLMRMSMRMSLMTVSMMGMSKSSKTDNVDEEAKDAD
jgi:hypothetical protein